MLGSSAGASLRAWLRVLLSAETREPTIRDLYSSFQQTDFRAGRSYRLARSRIPWVRCLRLVGFGSLGCVLIPSLVPTPRFALRKATVLNGALAEKGLRRIGEALLVGHQIGLSARERNKMAGGLCRMAVIALGMGTRSPQAKSADPVEAGIGMAADRVARREKKPTKYWLEAISSQRRNNGAIPRVVRQCFPF
jgi:hypothetical protein